MNFIYCNIKHFKGIPHNPTGQAVLEKSNTTLKVCLINRNVNKDPKIDYTVLYEL